MQLRRFTGDSTPLALGAVREALGDEAIILSNRQVDGRVEIVATAMLDEPALAAAKAFDPASATPVLWPAAMSSNDTAPLPASLSVTAAPPVTDCAPPRSVSAPTPAPTPAPTRRTPDEPASAPRNPPPDPSSTPLRAAGQPWFDEDLHEDVRPLTLERSVAPAAIPRTETEATSRPEPVAAATDAADAIESLLLRAERRHDERAERLQERLRRLEINFWGELDPVKASHLRQLLRLGIGAELGVRLAESIAPGSAPEAAMRRSLALLKASVPVVGDDTGSEPGVTVLSGPVGGGKTTALVKLATRHVQQYGNQSLVMIAADNRRIGAFESLQVYGRLLGVPVVQAHDGDELASLIEAFSHKSLVLVDHVPPERRETMPLPAAGTLGTHDGRPRRLRHLMVLPATLESRTFEALVERHVELGVTAGVLTQLDRAARLGVCFAPLVRHQLGIAYWSDNARVQTPLEKASASVLVATAMATGGHLAPSVDEELLLDLLQPTRRDVGETLEPGAVGVVVSATGNPSDDSPAGARSAARSAFPDTEPTR